MTADNRRDPSEPPVNGNIRYVTHHEHTTDVVKLTNRFLESHAELARGQEGLAHNDGAIMAELGRLHEDVAALSKGERVIRRKMASLPGVIKQAVEEHEETTGIHELRARIRTWKKLFWLTAPPILAGIVIALVLHYGFHLG